MARSSLAFDGALLLGAVTAMLAGAPAARAADGDVRVSSIGYVTGHAKRFSVAGGVGTTYAVRRAGDDSSAFAGTLGAAIADGTGDTVAGGDFGALDEAGSFYVDVAGVGRSGTFPIGGDAYRLPFSTVMLGFYGSRCGTAIAFEFQGTVYQHGACHLDDGLLDYLGQPGATRGGTHGWHDAGDFGKYTVNGAFAAGMMMAAWERHPDGLSGLRLPIPEEGGAVPDFLDEVRWQLDWLMTMQYPDGSGRVSHKLTALAFEGFIMPEADHQLRYFVPYGTAATADYVAALAQAARVYAPYDADFSARCLAAARASYAYIAANAANVHADQTGFTTGGYDGATVPDSDDRLWAAAELWETTGDAAPLADLEARIATVVATPRATLVDPDFDWSNTKNLGLYTYLLSKRTGRDAATLAAVRTAALAAADTVVANHDGSGYGRGVARYYWGSNGSIARTSMLLDVADQLSSDGHYLDVAADQIAYLFGRNHYDRSQVTGLGIDPPLHPHHRPSQTDGISDPFPGLLVGGGTTATNWMDDYTMFMVNEVAINWSAPLVYAMALFLPSGAWPPPVEVPPDAGAPAGDAAAPADAAPDAGAPGGGGAGGAPGAAGGTAKSGCSCAVDSSSGSGPGSAGVLFALALLGAAMVKRPYKHGAPRWNRHRDQRNEGHRGRPRRRAGDRRSER